MTRIEIDADARIEAVIDKMLERGSHEDEDEDSLRLDLFIALRDQARRRQDRIERLFEPGQVVRHRRVR